MAVNQKIAGTTTELPKSILKGTAVGIMLTIAGAAAMSGLIINEVLKETSIGYCAMFVLVISSYVSAVVAMTSAARQKAIVSMMSGLIYYVVLLGVNAICFKGGYEGVGATGLLILAGAGAAVLIEIRPKKRRNISLRKSKRR